MRIVAALVISVAAVMAVVPVGTASRMSEPVEAERIRNPEKSPSARTIELERLWKIGGFSESDDELFGVITDMVRDAKGFVYLLDLQLAEVKVFSSDGEYVRTIGREGEGPGEFQSPRRLFFLPDGNLCVVQSSPRRLSILNPDGTYVGELDVPRADEGGFQFVTEALYRGGTFVVQGLTTNMGDGFMDQISRVIRSDEKGGELKEFARTSRRLSFAKMVVRERDANPLAWTVGPNGRVFVVNGFDYAIEVRRPDGSLEHVITREYEHRARSEEEMEEVRNYFRRGGGTEGVEIDVMKYDRDIRWLEVADSGQIWLMTSRGREDSQLEDTLGTFDVYDQTGHLLEELTLKGEGYAERDRYYLLGDRFYVVTQHAGAVRSWQARVGSSASSTGDEPESDEEPEPMGVICYRFPSGMLR